MVAAGVVVMNRSNGWPELCFKEILSSMAERLARRGKNSLETQEIIKEDLNYDAHSENEMEIMVGIKRHWMEWIHIVSNRWH